MSGRVTFLPPALFSFYSDNGPKHSPGTPPTRAKSPTWFQVRKMRDYDRSQLTNDDLATADKPDADDL